MAESSYICLCLVGVFFFFFRITLSSKHFLLCRKLVTACYTIQHLVMIFNYYILVSLVDNGHQPYISASRSFVPDANSDYL